MARPGTVHAALRHDAWGRPPWDLPTPDEVGAAYRVSKARGVKVPRYVHRDLCRDPLFEFPPLDKGLDETFTDEDLAILREKLPQYRVKGPGVYAVCEGQHGLSGDKSRLIESRHGVHSVEEAAAQCDGIPGCTHFSVTVGPSSWKSSPDKVKLGVGELYRADFCKGPTVTTDTLPGSFSFAGIRKPESYLLPGPATPFRSSRLQDGPLKVATAAPVPLPMFSAAISGSDAARRPRAARLAEFL
eukprot:TRINITY_DN10555_c1_g1_i1.p1 TRINITY_DN10555_c1_g1~~TRINITY_DN10555_c1_g1_i1.p1  ORF type:complete len:244 (-),score=44.40 TRINITY_DN10555_c1_g1_i1:68-799(-)